MGDLKPLGSEKLEGQEKIKRIIEISRYNENRPSNINETSRSEYGISLADGNEYQIVREKLGYIIKKTISESETDYIEPMKNRKYYSSYGQALKRLNLLTKEVNRLTENNEGTSLFGEQKKFVLKTPKSAPADDEASENMPPAPAAPPEVPTPELPQSPESTPPSPEGAEMPTGDMGGEMPDMEDMGGEMPDMEEKGGDEEVTFKSIQKLTGKLTQKMREFDNEKGLTSENIKYVINMVLSAADLSALSEEDKEDIISKFDEEEGMEDMGGEEMPDMGGEEMPDMGGEEMGTEPEGEMGESLYGSIIDSIFGESKIDKVISKYFQVSDKEKRMIKESQQKRKLIVKSDAKRKMKEVVKLSETIEQELASQKFLEENSSFVFVGKTNKQNLVFENKNKQIKISPEGLIL
jgi:hypothetical protein